MTEWYRALHLKSGGPRFKSSTLPLSWICFSVVPSSNPPLRLVNSQLVCLPLVGIFNNLCSVSSICLCVYGISFARLSRGLHYIGVRWIAFLFHTFFCYWAEEYHSYYRDLRYGGVRE